MKYYKAFGFMIESEVTLELLRPLPETEAADIRILRADLRAWHKRAVDSDRYCDLKYVDEPDAFYYSIEDKGCAFLIEHGDTILVDAAPDAPEPLLAVYILGHCMGTIFIQRGLFALHASCVCRDGRAVAIAGYSGAGKSTLAAEFLRRGWQLMSDDVTLLCKRDGVVCARSSYPSQKLWQDAADRIGAKKEELLPLWQENRKEKFHLRREEQFFEGEMPLSVLVALQKDCKDEEICTINDFAGVDILMKTWYKNYIYSKNWEQRLFQESVCLAPLLPVVLVSRREGENSAARLVDAICAEMMK